MKKCLFTLCFGIIGLVGVSYAQSTPSFEEAYAQMLQYVQLYSPENEQFTHTNFDHQLGVKGKVEGVSFDVNLHTQGNHNRVSGDLQHTTSLGATFAEGVDFFGEVKGILEMIIKDGAVFYKLSDLSGSLTEYGESMNISAYLDTGFVNTRIKSDSDYLDLGISYADISSLKQPPLNSISLPEYPLWEVVKQEGNVFTLKWNTLNLAKFIKDSLKIDSFSNEMILDILRDLEDTVTITMKVEDKTITLSFVGEDEALVIQLSDSSLSLQYQEFSDVFYLIFKKGTTSDKLGFVVVEDGVAQVLGTFDLQRTINPAISQNISLKGNIKTLESSLEEVDVTIDYLGQEKALPSLDIQAPSEYIAQEAYSRGEYEDEPEFENSRAFFDYYYAEEQEQYGTFCDSDDTSCSLATKEEILALPVCKVYFDSYIHHIAQFDQDEQSYYVKEFIDELDSLQEMNLPYATYFCEYYSDYYTSDSIEAPMAIVELAD